MGLADLHALVPVVAAAGEKSKTAFYIAGGVLAAWAVLVSVVGVTRPGFPGGLTGQRAVIGISASLVVLTVAMAVVTASKPPKESEAKAQAPAPPPPGGGAAVAIAADPSGQLKFNTKSASAKPGRVVIDFNNSSPVPHNVTIQQGSKTLTATSTITQSKTSVTTALKPGTYTFFCSVDAHRQAGMVGTLKVG